MSNQVAINKATYHEYLKKADRGELKATSELADLELKIVSGLLDAGLVSNSKERFLSQAPTNKTFLTPKGAMTLHEWDKEVRESSFFYKLGSGLTRFLWIIVGVIAAAITRWAG